MARFMLIVQVALCLMVAIPCASILGVLLLMELLSALNTPEGREAIPFIGAAIGVAFGAISIWGIVRLTNIRHAKRHPDNP